MDVPHYFTQDRVGRLLDASASHNRHQARGAELITWRTGLRVSEAPGLEWRDLDHSGEPPTFDCEAVQDSESWTVRTHGDLGQLFANWPADWSLRDKVAPLAMRTVLRHMGDGVEKGGCMGESPGTGMGSPGRTR